MKACIRTWTYVWCVCVCGGQGGWPSKSILTSCWGKVLPAVLCHTEWPANFEMPLFASHLIEGTLGLQTDPSMPDVAWALGSNFRPHTVKARTCCTELHSHPLSSHFKMQKLSKTGLFSVFTQTVHNRMGLKPANWLTTLFLWVVIWRT